MTNKQFREALEAFGLAGSQYRDGAPAYDMSPRQVQRMAYGESPVSGPVRKLTALILAKKVSIKDVINA